MVKRPDLVKEVFVILAYDMEDNIVGRAVFQFYPTQVDLSNTLVNFDAWSAKIDRRYVRANANTAEGAVPTTDWRG